MNCHHQVAALGQEPVAQTLPTADRVRAQFMAGAITADDAATQLQSCNDAVKSVRELR